MIEAEVDERRGSHHVGIENTGITSATLLN